MKTSEAHSENVCTKWHSITGKDSFKGNSRKDMTHVNLEGHEIFEKMSKLLGKYEDMKRSFREQLSFSWQVRGLRKQRC